MRTALTLIVVLTPLTTSGQAPTTRPATEPAYVDTSAFCRDFRIEHYLAGAAEIQKLDPDERAARLKALAADPKRASEVFPLCRMLFEAKPKGGFRRPSIGGASFVRGDHADWPLEPITIFENVPILVVRGYSLFGFPESPARYVGYCLEECTWRDVKYQPTTPRHRREVVERFIAAREVTKAGADRLRRQAD